MGVVNVTPDSFYDGGNFLSPNGPSNTRSGCWTRAPTSWTSAVNRPGRVRVSRARKRQPNAQPVSEGEELQRILPVIEGILRVEAGCR